jgi:hypothetical protein
MGARIGAASSGFVCLAIVACASNASTSGSDGGTMSPNTNRLASDGGTVESDSGTSGGDDATRASISEPEAGSSDTSNAEDAAETAMESGTSDSSTVPVALPGVDPSANLSGLSQTQLGELCDWWAMLYGGYNVSTSCPPNGSISTPTNHAQCIATLHFRCSVTVSHFETCMEVQLPSHGCVIGQPQCSFQNC